MIGRTVSHYKILEKIGEGGMGIVYKAEDMRLKRLVALKFLPSESLADEKSKSRIMREARAAAALDHPNICSIHEIDEDNGRIFIVMSYCDGSTLRDALSSGPLPAGNAVDICIQVAEGLEAAHEKGIIHRDIKPSNVMIEKGRNRVQIMDFGLARQVGSDSTFKTLSHAGTSAYMSPEHISGEDIDERTDIWALGVILYELLTGNRPFVGRYEAALFYSILHEDPEPLDRKVPGISDKLATIVQNALEKDPSDRYQTIGDLLTDLKEVAAEETVRDASHHITRTAHGRKRIRKTYATAAVTFVAASAIIISLWYFIARQAVDESRPPDLSAPGDSVLTEADILFERGQELYQNGNQPMGITLIEQALEIDPEHFKALKALATYYDFSGESRIAADYIARAKKIAIRRGNTMDLLQCNIVESLVYHNWDMAVRYLENMIEERPEEVTTYLNTGYILSRYKKDFPGAIRKLKKVLELDPDNTRGLNGQAWNYLGTAYLYSGKFNEAIEAYGKYREQAPAGAPDPLNSIARAYRLSGQYKKAIEQFQSNIGTDRHNFTAYEGMGKTYLSLGMWQKAIDAFNRYIGAVQLRGLKEKGHQFLAEVYLEQSDSVRFYQEMAILNEMNPKSIRTCWLAGRFALRSRSDLKTAKAELRKMKQVIDDPFVFDGDACYQHLKGLILLEERRYSDAIEAIADSKRISSREFFLFGKELIAAYIAAGRFADAIAEGEELKRFNGNDAGLMMLMAEAHASAGEMDRAEECCAKVRNILAEADPGYHPLEEFISKFDKST